METWHVVVTVFLTVFSASIAFASLVWAMFSHRDKKISSEFVRIWQAVTAERDGREALERVVTKSVAEITSLQGFLCRFEQLHQTQTSEIKDGMKTFAEEMKRLGERMVEIKETLQESIHEVRDKVIAHTGDPNGKH